MNRYTMKTTAYARATKAREPVTLELHIDWDKLARHFADKAFANKTGKTLMLGGTITAKILKGGTAA